MESFKNLSESEKSNKIFEILLKLQQQQDSYNKKLDGFIADINQIKINNEKIINDLSNVTITVKNLQQENQKLKMQVNSTEQEFYNKYSTILGLPKITSNQLKNIIHNLSNKIKYPITKNRILKEYYVVNEDENKSHMVLRFFDERDKIEFTEAFKKNMPITTQDILSSEGPETPNNKLYIKDKLSGYNQQLKKICKKYINKEFKYVWDANGKILVREEDCTKIIHIESIEKLVAVVNKIREQKNNKSKTTNTKLKN